MPPAVSVNTCSVRQNLWPSSTRQCKSSQFPALLRECFGDRTISLLVRQINARAPLTCGARYGMKCIVVNFAMDTMLNAASRLNFIHFYQQNFDVQ
jgi:hypothetical protein